MAVVSVIRDGEPFDAFEAPMGGQLGPFTVAAGSWIVIKPLDGLTGLVIRNICTAYEFERMYTRAAMPPKGGASDGQ